MSKNIIFHFSPLNSHDHENDSPYVHACSLHAYPISYELLSTARATNQFGIRRTRRAAQLGHLHSLSVKLPTLPHLFNLSSDHTDTALIGHSISISWRFLRYYFNLLYANTSSGGFGRRGTKMVQVRFQQPPIQN